MAGARERVLDTLARKPTDRAPMDYGAHPAVTSPIVGARNADQLAPALEAPGIDMTAELHADIAALSRTPPPATDRLEELGEAE